MRFLGAHPVVQKSREPAPMERQFNRKLEVIYCVGGDHARPSAGERLGVLERRIGCSLSLAGSMQLENWLALTLALSPRRGN